MSLGYRYLFIGESPVVTIFVSFLLHKEACLFFLPSSQVKEKTLRCCSLCIPPQQLAEHLGIAHSSSTALSQLPGLPEEIVFQVVQFIMSAVTCKSLSLIPSPVSGKGLFIKSGGSVV